MDSFLLSCGICLSALLSLLREADAVYCKGSQGIRYCRYSCCWSVSLGTSCCGYVARVTYVSWYYIVAGVVGALVIAGGIGAVIYFSWRAKTRRRVIPHTVTTANTGGITVVSSNTSTTLGAPMYGPPPPPAYYPPYGAPPSPYGPPASTSSQPLGPAYPPGMMGPSPHYGTGAAYPPPGPSHHPGGGHPPSYASVAKPVS